jgi:hypothetical protein
MRRNKSKIEFRCGQLWAKLASHLVRGEDIMEVQVLSTGPTTVRV